MPGEDPLLDLLLFHNPTFYAWIVRRYYAAPAAAVIVGGLVLITVWRVWFENVGGNLTALKLLPPWPLSPDKDGGPRQTTAPEGLLRGTRPYWICRRRRCNPGKLVWA